MEILQVADNVAREKNIDKDVVIVAMEEAIQKAGRSKYGFDQHIRATIDRKKGTIAPQRFREVVEELDPEAEAVRKDSDISKSEQWLMLLLPRGEDAPPTLQPTQVMLCLKTVIQHAF